ncbi:MAG: hypothetical protein KGY45_01270 [Hadesarchaea archaeon]|nr:hypothetical protein [Hadesarchaea archaeon]
MENLDEKGVSDIIVVAFMFILLVLASVLVHQYNTRALESAADRQNELKSIYLYESLSKSELSSYGLTFFDAAGEHLVLESPTVPENYLRDWLENTSGFLLPDDYGLKLTLSHGENQLEFTHPNKVSDNIVVGESFIQSGSLAITKTGGEVELVNIKLNLFKIS